MQTPPLLWHGRPARVFHVARAASPCLLLVLLFPAFADQSIDPAFHHLRSGPTREWSSFPASAEGKSLTNTFDSHTNQTEETLRLRHRDLKNTWKLTLNNRPLITLPPDEADTITYLPVPPHALRDGPNTLLISCTGGPAPSDDIDIGEINLLQRPRKDTLSESTLNVTVLDGDSHAPLPCRITITTTTGSLITTGAESTNDLAVRPGVLYTATGKAHIPLPAGRYTLYASRGFEYSLATAEIDLNPGGSLTKQLEIRREVSTPGYVACDTHIHTFTYSRHGDCTIAERMITLAGEGIELPIATDHNIAIDYEKPATETHTRQFFTPVTGNEITTPSQGHLNVFPFPAVVSNPKPIWQAPTWETLFRSIHETAGPDPVIILNHARDTHGNFRPFDPSIHLSVTGTRLDDRPIAFNAMEIINSGAVQTNPTQLFRDHTGLLNHGYKLTPVGSSDSHDVSRYIVGQGRTYIRCDDADPAHIDVAGALANFHAGKVLVSYGLLCTITVNDRFTPGDLATISGDSMKVELRILGPGWTAATHLTLYADGIPLREFELTALPDHPLPAGMKFETTLTLPRPAHDTYLTALAVGPGISSPHWPTAKPYQPTSESFTPYTLAATAPVYIDADNDRQFTSPRKYADQLLKDAPDLAALPKALWTYDQAVAAQAADLYRLAHPGEWQAQLRIGAQSASPHIRQAWTAYLTQWPPDRR